MNTEECYARIENLYGEEIKPKLKEAIIGAINFIPFEGDSGNEAETDRYCIMRLAEGMNDYLCSSNYNSVFRQRIYEKYRWKILLICEKCHIDDSDTFLENMEIPVVSDPGIAFVKALHEREGKTKEVLAEELGISERMVRINARKLDASMKARKEADYGEFRLGGQAMHVPIKTVTGSDGKIRLYTPNTLHPVSLQMNLYQTIILLESLMHECYENSGVAIMLAAMVWAQLSGYAKRRIRFYCAEKKPELREFIEEIEEFLSDEDKFLFMTEKEMQESDWIDDEDRRMIDEKHALW